MIRGIEQRGNQLSPDVRIFHLRNRQIEFGVELLSPPKSEIPQSALVTSVLNAAMITEFGLGVCLAVEGGVEGRYGRKCKNGEVKRTYVSLINGGDNLSLYVESDYSQGPDLTRVLKFYEKMLRLLFKEPLEDGEQKYRRGEILRLPKEEQTPDKIWGILRAMLKKVGGKKFPQRVMKFAVKNASNPFSGPYLRGLSNEEIVERFVPPPNL